LVLLPNGFTTFYGSIEEASTLRMMPGLARCLYETQNRCDAVYIYIYMYSMIIFFDAVEGV